MGTHDDYGKDLMRAVAGELYLMRGSQTTIQYNGNISAQKDGVILNQCAVEIESRVPKQIRGALVDLIMHPLPKKLIIIIPEHMNDSKGTVEHCKGILEHFNRGNYQFRVVLLTGTGYNKKFETDIELIRNALISMGCRI